MADWLGQTIGKVRIEKYLAHGGMAEVYLGTHMTLERQVAVKFMHRHVETEPDLLDRFQREAKAVAGLRHPNIVQIFDFDTYEGHPYIVMEYLRGPSLANYLRDLHDNGAKLSLEQITHLLKSLTSGVDYAHSQNIIHRDIKPANIILHNKSDEYSPTNPLPKDTEPILTDFGLVRITTSTTKTITGLVSGTPAYMSPEQAQGMATDHRSDIYSLGIVLYEMLAGNTPFEGDSTLGIILKHINEPPPPIEDIAPEVQAVINKALSKNPKDRHQSARELFTEFYRAVGLNAESETVHSLRIQTPVPATVSTKPAPRRNNLLWVGVGLFVCLCFGFITTSILGVSVFSFFPFIAGTTPTAAQPQVTATTDVSTPSANSLPTESPSLGVLRFQGLLDQVTISANLPDPPAGNQYEAWLIENDGESHISLGILSSNGTGQHNLTYIDPQNRNLLENYASMEITLESNSDTSPNSSGNVLYSSRIPSGSLTHIRHLLVQFEETPGLTRGLLNTAQLIHESAKAMQDAFGDKNSKTVRTNAEAIVNLIVGDQSNEYGDWDSNRNINDPGDGFGLLLNGDHVGYIGGTISHTEYAMESPDATEGVKLHGGHVIVSARNVEEWATQLRDVAKRLATVELAESTEADIRLAVSLAEQILTGLDINGNESVEPIAGEGGAATAFEHAEYMTDMPILEGEGQTPPPAE
jgi:serine/threonine protein kinase